MLAVYLTPLQSHRKSQISWSAMAWIHLWLTPRQLSVIGLRMIKKLAVTRCYAWFLVCLGINWIPETSASLPNTKGSIRSSDWLYPFCFFLLSPNNLALFNQRKLYFQTRVSIQTDLFHLRLWHQSLSCHTWVFFVFDHWNIGNSWVGYWIGYRRIKLD